LEIMNIREMMGSVLAGDNAAIGASVGRCPPVI